MRPLVLAGAILTTLTRLMAVKQEDFKRCDQSGFCRRSRDRLEEVASGESLGWRVNPKSLVFQAGSGLLTFSLQKGEEVTLAARLEMLEDGRVLRLQVDELAVPGGPSPRYRVPAGDVVSAELVAAADEWQELRPDEPGHRVYGGPDGLALHLYLEPFQMLLLDGDEVAAELNALGLFHVETGQEVKEVIGENSVSAEMADSETGSDPDDSSPSFYQRDGPSPKEKGERWGKHVDSQPRGPQALSLDISFPASRHLYGLPEHTTSLDLRTTCRLAGRNVTYADEPYRLYNLDVFEYEIGSTMALYGSVPFVLAGRGQRRLGVFWQNPSETWVDVVETAGRPGRALYWRSESGIIDLFLFAGHRTAGAVLTAYAGVTGFPALPPQWSLGYHQCRWNYKTQTDLLAVHAGFDEHRIPLDVLWLDIEHTDGKRYFTWDAQMFPEPDAMLRALESKGRRLVTIVDPHIKTDEAYGVYRELTEARLAVLDAHRQLFTGHCWPG